VHHDSADLAVVVYVESENKESRLDRDDGPYGVVQREVAGRLPPLVGREAGGALEQPSPFVLVEPVPVRHVLHDESDGRRRKSGVASHDLGAPEPVPCVRPDRGRSCCWVLDQSPCIEVFPAADDQLPGADRVRRVGDGASMAAQALHVGAAATRSADVKGLLQSSSDPGALP